MSNLNYPRSIYLNETFTLNSFRKLIYLLSLVIVYVLYTTVKVIRGVMKKEFRELILWLIILVVVTGGFYACG